MRKLAKKKEGENMNAKKVKQHFLSLPPSLSPTLRPLSRFILNAEGTLVYQKTGRPKEKVLGVVPLREARAARQADASFEATMDVACCFSIATPERVYHLVR